MCLYIYVYLCQCLFVVGWKGMFLHANAVERTGSCWYTWLRQLGDMQVKMQSTRCGRQSCSQCTRISRVMALSTRIEPGGRRPWASWSAMRRRCRSARRAMPYRNESRSLVYVTSVWKALNCGCGVVKKNRRKLRFLNWPNITTCPRVADSSLLTTRYLGADPPQ